jgi:hypothetical protein
VPLLALALLLLLPLAVIALMPLILIQRYRFGSARQLARPWLATLNVVAMTFSVAFFLAAAAVTSIWLPTALPSSAVGVMVGCLLGAIGLKLSRWEETPRALHYTPNRWLVLGITLFVAVRVLYGFWRGWMSWGATADATSFAAAVGVAGSLAAGAVVLGYYLAYGIGLRRRIGKWQKRALRVMD